MKHKSAINPYSQILLFSLLLNNAHKCLCGQPEVEKIFVWRSLKCENCFQIGLKMENECLNIIYQVYNTVELQTFVNSKKKSGSVKSDKPLAHPSNCKVFDTRICSSEVFKLLLTLA